MLECANTEFMKNIITGDDDVVITVMTLKQRHSLVSGKHHNFVSIVKEIVTITNNVKMMLTFFFYHQE